MSQPKRFSEHHPLVQITTIIMLAMVAAIAIGLIALIGKALWGGYLWLWNHV